MRVKNPCGTRGIFPRGISASAPRERFSVTAY
jgi:hypothetical protein